MSKPPCAKATWGHPCQWKLPVPPPLGTGTSTLTSQGEQFQMWAGGRAGGPRGVLKVEEGSEGSQAQTLLRWARLGAPGGWELWT